MQTWIAVKPPSQKTVVFAQKLGVTTIRGDPVTSDSCGCGDNIVVRNIGSLESLCELIDEKVLIFGYIAHGLSPDEGDFWVSDVWLTESKMLVSWDTLRLSCDAASIPVLEEFARGSRLHLECRRLLGLLPAEVHLRPLLNIDEEEPLTPCGELFVVEEVFNSVQPDAPAKNSSSACFLVTS